MKAEVFIKKALQAGGGPFSSLFAFGFLIFLVVRIETSGIAGTAFGDGWLALQPIDAGLGSAAVPERSAALRCIALH